MTAGYCFGCGRWRRLCRRLAWCADCLAARETAARGKRQ
jgi:hypothetical protein